jgi:hypothetical protein
MLGQPIEFDGQLLFARPIALDRGLNGVDPALPYERKLRSGHGSLTPDEMYVPLLAATGTR